MVVLLEAVFHEVAIFSGVRFLVIAVGVGDVGEQLGGEHYGLAFVVGVVGGIHRAEVEWLEVEWIVGTVCVGGAVLGEVARIHAN